MAMITSWEEARSEARADAVLTVLDARGISVPAHAREIILAQRDPELLKRWLVRASVASSLTEVIGEPS